MGGTVVIGIGNEYRGDDAVGRVVARRIVELGLPEVTVGESTGESLSLMELWKGAEKAILVDALESGAEPGMVRRFDAGKEALPVEFVRTCSTHALSLAEGVELARSLGELPAEVVVFGIEGAGFEHGEPLTSSALRGVERAVGCIEEELKTIRPCV